MTGIIEDRRRQFKLRHRRQLVAGRLLLRRAGLNDEIAARQQPRTALRYEAIEDAEAARTALEGRQRLVLAHADGQFRNILVRDIGRITYNAVKLLAGVQRSKQITFEKPDAADDIVLRGI